VIDYEYIRARLLTLRDRFHISEVGIDPWDATQFTIDLRDRWGFKVIEVPQGARHMNEPTKQLLRLVKAKKLNHGGNPVLKWMADNMVVTTDANHNVRPNKEKSKQKIDGIVALIIALSRVIAGAGLGSGYDARIRAGAESIIRKL
jgi:phage terminase large subunit-like protein